MKLNKKISMIALGASALSLVAVAAPRLDVAELNAVATEILTPFQTPKSKATLQFVSLAVDDANVRNVKVKAFYERTGKGQTMQVNLNELTHDFAGGRPVTKAKGHAKFDLTMLFQPEQADSLVDGAEEMVKDMASNFTAPYGEAVTLEARMLEKLKGADGHYTSFKASVTATIDLTKLPADKKAEDMPFLTAVINVSVVLATGIDVTAEVQHNPGYKGFRAGDATNLKVGLEKLLNRDGATKEQILTILKKIDAMAATVVDARTR